MKTTITEEMRFRYKVVKYAIKHSYNKFYWSNFFVTGGFTIIISYAIGYFLIRKASIKK